MGEGGHKQPLGGARLPVATALDLLRFLKQLEADF